MTGALVIYSAIFMRYALAVTPRNYLLFGCHAVNFTAQATQGYRYLNYWKYVFSTFWFLRWFWEDDKLTCSLSFFLSSSWGGREAKIAADAAKEGKSAAEAGA